MRDEIAAGFRSRFGAGPTIVVRSPGRVNLIGDHTDYNDGFVLPAAIDHATWFAARPRIDRIVRLHSAEQGAAELDLDALVPTGEWTDYVAGTIRELRFEVEYGFDAYLGTEIPVGAGLSSSAALEMGVARFVAEFAGAAWDPLEAALAGQRAENHFVGMPCGIMDQLIVATAREGAASLIDCRSLESTPASIPGDVMVVILDTGTRRKLVDSAYEDRRAACERVAAALGVPALRDATLDQVMDADLDAVDHRRAVHVIRENSATQQLAAALDAGDIASAGRLMNESHASLRDDYEVSSPALDAMADIARDQEGCFGARMTGAGFAGCAVALVATDHVEHFVDDTGAQYRAATDREPQLYRTTPSAAVSLA
jgi:galactokinase